MVDARFSALASVATAIVAALAALDGAVVAAVLWGVLAVGFGARAIVGYRRR